MVLESHPRPARTSPRIDHAYATNVAADKAVRFIKRHRDDADPYFLEVAVYGPHSQMAAAYPHQPQFPSAMADRAPAGHPKGGNCGLKACRDLAITDLLGYDDPRWNNRPTYLHADGSTTRAPAWRTNKITLTRGQALARYRDRARMVQSIDRMLGRIRHVIGPDTYLVLTADNGFHLGQHQLNGGKGAPYDSDSRVPLIVVGPDVVAGTRQQFVNNIDLAPTFEVLAGLKPARYRSGIPFAKTFARPEAATARYAFFEHTYAKSVPGEVDLDMGSGGTIDIIPSFIAVRGDRGLLVRFDLDKSWTRHELRVGALPLRPPLGGRQRLRHRPRRAVGAGPHATTPALGRLHARPVPRRRPLASSGCTDRTARAGAGRRTTPAAACCTAANVRRRRPRS